VPASFCNREADRAGKIPVFANLSNGKELSLNLR
jgi:hypothetical protein